MFKAVKALTSLLLLVGALGRQPSALQRNLLNGRYDIDAENQTHSLDISNCPGYTLGGVAETNAGLTAQLSLAGTACNAFGQDIASLTIEVTYETQTRLHVKIYDADNKQFTIPENVIARPAASTAASYQNSSDLVFNYDPSPFAFWITRRSSPNATPLFDTRSASLPQGPTPPLLGSDNSTALGPFPLVFEDEYLQVSSALPLGTNIYGLGEVVSSSGFRRNVSATIQTLWARDIEDPIDQNVYGSHPVYLEHRYDEASGTSQSHGVFLLSSAGADIFLATPPGGNQSLIEYRLIGGVLDFYFFSGPDPKSVVEQYGEVVGLPTWQPAWGFGFHLCRWGYYDVNETRLQVENMRAADIPLEVMWNDIDLYHAVRDFTSDPVTFPGDQMRAFIQNLTANHQHYIPIVDAAVAIEDNATDIYDPYTSGIEQKTFITNPDGTEYIGQVWPGYTVFPDWFASNTEAWWTQALQNWSNSGIEFSGIWLDMNEISSFCNGSCGTGADLTNTTIPVVLPGSPGALVTAYPECYNSTISGPSGNLTMDGTSTYECSTASSSSTLSKRGLGAAGEPEVSLNTPPYAVHNGNGPLWALTLATNATHAPGYVELDVHNMWGLMEERATNLALQSILPGKRPFIISRSTFPSSGKWTGHWLGDNYSKWQYMAFSIQGVLQFQLYQIPMVGADTCGFIGNTDEELCGRWMQLSAFMPFFRNHNQRGAISQEPYRWDSVANASRSAIATRYSLLPYWYTLFANVSTHGTPPVRALFFEFPDEPELFGIDTQYLVGSDILVTPVLTPNATTVNGIFPGRGSVAWRDWYTHAAVNATPGANTTLAAPLGHINVHIRSGSAILLHANPAYTIYETRSGPYELLISLAADGSAFGNAYIDDGESSPPGPSTSVTFVASAGQLVVRAQGAYYVEQAVQDVTILGTAQPSGVTVGGKTVEGWEYDAPVERLVVKDVNLDLNAGSVIAWK